MEESTIEARLKEQSKELGIIWVPWIMKTKEPLVYISPRVRDGIKNCQMVSRLFRFTRGSAFKLKYKWFGNRMVNPNYYSSIKISNA